MKVYSVFCSVSDGGAYVLVVNAESAMKAKDEAEQSHTFNSGVDVVIAVVEGRPDYVRSNDYWEKVN